LGPLPNLNIVFLFLKKYPDQMFVFKDQKACLTYHKDADEILYLHGHFNTERDTKYNTHVALMAKEAQNN
jgi:hypothetical protein